MDLTEAELTVHVCVLSTLNNEYKNKGLTSWPLSFSISFSSFCRSLVSSFSLFWWAACRVVTRCWRDPTLSTYTCRWAHCNGKRDKITIFSVWRARMYVYKPADAKDLKCICTKFLLFYIWEGHKSTAPTFRVIGSSSDEIIFHKVWKINGSERTLEKTAAHLQMFASME